MNEKGFKKKDDTPLSSYSPPPIKVKNPTIQTTHTNYGGHGPIAKSKVEPKHGE